MSGDPHIKTEHMKETQVSAPINLGDYPTVEVGILHAMTPAERVRHFGILRPFLVFFRTALTIATKPSFALCYMARSEKSGRLYLVRTQDRFVA